MRGLAFPVLCISLCLLGCEQKKDEVFSAEKIRSIHQRLDSLSNDSVFNALQDISEKLLEDPLLPDSLRAENNYLLGQYYQRLSIIDSAAIFYHNATDFVKDTITTDREGVYFSSAWNAYKNLGLHAECLSLSNRFKSLLDIEEHRGLSWAYYWEHLALIGLGDYQKAGRAIDQYVSNTRKADTSNLLSALISQAEFYYYYLNKKKEAYGILEELITAPSEVSKRYRFAIFTNYGVYKYYEGDYRSALSYYLKAQNAANSYTFEDQFDQVNTLATGYSNIAEVYMDLGDYRNARKYLDSSRLLGIENLDRNMQKSLLSYEVRYAVEAPKNSENITSIIDEINDHQDKLYSQKTEKELLSLTKANEKEKQILKDKLEVELANSNLKNSLLIGGIIGSFLLSLGLVFFFQRKLRYERKSLQWQQRLLRSQMNPHFTSNTLYAIQAHIKKEPEQAESYLLKFSRLLRLFLENSIDNFVPMEQEIESLKKYMDLQLFTKKDSFSYSFSYENMKEDEFVFIPPMLLQPFVENCIHHGFNGLRQKGVISIHLKMLKKFIECTIEDNGNGYLSEEDNKEQSISTQLISNYLKRATGTGVETVNKSELDASSFGVIVRFKIPFRVTESA